MPQSDAPVDVLFAFANDRLEETRYLRNLPHEQRRVREAMEPAVTAGLCRTIERSNATVDEIFDVFQDPGHRHRIAIFHFGGHAGSGKLFFETSDGGAKTAHARGLAALLTEQHGLELVFLNGCSSDGQARALLDAGVAAVIATSQAIDDEVASEFAARFYKSLAAGAALRTAFNEAEAAVRARRGDEPRAAYRSFVPPEVGARRWPWELYVADGAGEHASKWSLPLAAKNPLYSLPAPAPRDLPASPFKNLDWFTRRDAEVFFGRGREIRDLYEAVTAPDGVPIVMLFGASGAGKSSLLDAGLRPRLEASHEVLYLRRDGALGLAQTLAEHLEGRTGRNGDEGRSDRLAERLPTDQEQTDQELDALVLELLGGDPQSSPNEIDRTIALRARGLSGAWHAREVASGRPLVVILDQVEEAYIRPLASLEAETTELVSTLRGLFAVPASRPRGRLILSFRKEWLAEVTGLLDVAKLPRARVEIRHLGKQGILEAIEGPSSSDRLRRHYHLHIEQGLAETIAADLLRDSGGAIAPTLQILLTKMWREARVQRLAAPCFTTELYQRLRRRGILLGDFLDEQLEELAGRCPRAVDSGLAIDLLAYHTTALGTSETRRLAEVQQRYGDWEILELIRCCCESFLLTTTGELDQDPSATRLAHDTLAPLVRQRFEESRRPGQQALRILAQRTVGWEEDGQRHALDSVDLAMVEKGASGMRLRTPAESDLIAASYAALRRRKRRRRRNLGAAVAVLLAVVAYFLFDGQEKGQRPAEIQKIAWDADRLLELDPTRFALHLLEELEEPGSLDDGVSWMLKVVEQPLAKTVLHHPKPVRLAVFSGSAGQPTPRDALLTGAADGTAWVWNADGTGASIALRGHQGSLLDAAFDSTGDRIVTASADGTARVWSSDGEVLAVFESHNDIVFDLEIAGDRIATASADGTARVWSLDGHELTVFEDDGSGAVLSVAFDTSGARVVTGSTDGVVRLWEVVGGEPIRLEGHDGAVMRAEFAPDGTHVLTASRDGTARIWPADGHGEPMVLEGHQGFVTSAVFDRAGEKVLTGSSDGTARIWFLDGREPIVLGSTARGDSAGGIRSAAFDAEGKQVLAVSGADASKALVWIWSDTDDFAEPMELRGHQGLVLSAGFDASGDKVVTSSLDGTARIWELTDLVRPVASKDLSELAVGESSDPVSGMEEMWNLDDRVLAEEVDVDGRRRVVTASSDGQARIWREGNSHPILLPRQEGEIVAAAFETESRRLFTASEGGFLRQWSDYGAGNPEDVHRHQRPIVDVRFAFRSGSDGLARAVTVFKDGRARIWELDNPEVGDEIYHLDGPIRSIAFSARGSMAVTVSEQGSVYLWKITAAGVRRYAELSPNRRTVRAAFSAAPAPSTSSAPDREAFRQLDSRRLITEFEDGTVRDWKISFDELRDAIASRTSACLEPRSREQDLDESPETAWANYVRCETRHGRCPLLLAESNGSALSETEEKTKKAVHERLKGELRNCPLPRAARPAEIVGATPPLL